MAATYSIVDFANQADFDARLNGTSPTVTVASGGGGAFNYLDAYNASHIRFTGGTYNDLDAYDASVVDLTRGRIKAGIYARSSSHVNLSGGLAGFLNDNSSVSWSSGGIAGNVIVLGNATPDAYGTGLVQTLVHPDSQGFRVYTLTGQLADGGELTKKSIYVQNTPAGSRSVQDVPEPAGLAACSALGVAAARRKRGEARQQSN